MIELEMRDRWLRFLRLRATSHVRLRDLRLLYTQLV